MEIKLELLKNSISEIIISNLDAIDIDISKIADTTAISAITEIQQCIKDSVLSDFDVVEKIVAIFEKYHIDAGSRHDF